jgi:YihY family inner membrane protein
MTAIAERLRQRWSAVSERHAVLGIAADALQHFNAHEAMPRAAAIAYYSILSLFPFAMVALVAASLIIGQGPELDAFVARFAEAFELDPEDVATALVALRDAQVWLAILGIGLLVVALIPWVSAVQRGIVRAFEEERRSYVRTTLGSILLLGSAAILILLSGVWTSLIGLVVGVVDRFLPEVVIVDFTLTLVISILPAVVVFGVMVVLLRSVPAADPTLGDVWFGALVTALGFLGLSLLFDLYVQLFVADSGNASGPFGAILVGLLYIDFLAVTLLAGVEVAAATRRRRLARHSAG